MMTATAIVSLIASAGWLFLNIRAFRSHRVPRRQQIMMAAAWVVIFVAAAMLLSNGSD